MATIQITVSDSEKKQIDELFKKMGMTISSATKIFYKQALQDNGLPFRPQVTKNVSPHVIKTEIDKDGTLVFPNDVPNDVKEWIKNG